MEYRSNGPVLLGYEFRGEQEAREAAADLDRRFADDELSGLRIYRVRWNSNFLVEATFPPDTPPPRLDDARALLGESGSPVHPDDLTDYKEATEKGAALPGWMRRWFGA